MVSVRKRTRSVRGTRPIVTAFWCTTIVALVFVHLLICTSFTSASYPARLEERNDKFLILNKYAPARITETPAVQDPENAAAAASSPTTESKRDTEQEQASILALLEAYNGPPQAPEDQTSSVKKGAAAQQPVLFTHRKWTKFSHDAVQYHHRQQQLDLAHPATNNYQKNKLLEETTTKTTTTTNLVMKLLSKIWKDMILMTLRVRGVDHKRSLYPPAAAGAAATTTTATTHHQIRRRRMMRPTDLRRKLPESNNKNNKFPHTSNNDFDSDYRDPENHPPRSN
ncbi:unnamed protein product [Sphagnum balticum]